MSNENQVESSISNQCHILKDILGRYATNLGGVAVIAEDINEKIMMGYNNVVGPRILVTFISEENYGPEDIQDVTGFVRRYFDIVVQRGKLLSDPRNSGLTSNTGPSKAFYEVVEEIRDICRCVVWSSPMIQNPTEYHGVYPFSQGEWLMDSYVIKISTICMIGRVQTNPAQLGDGLYVGVDDPLNMASNQSP